ncbi:hypothetical protein N7462_005022 [Penicillium macrosclerotiorum]|uniref:uncharacterized protein n=1 Tax=Penicillium macrosclerotiorum TaxID=303699 RepID=UPI00254835CF|nr:uncharacterized protein N7462_005022 [Penicillium macrosclerotiorum]KAJ5690630.1 hypothetical protein N7462_005022 [Penicillium macrosclerotiorum]
MDSKTYLAENVLNEQRTVTYRALSRALKVHANRAKQNENAKKSHSVHATYVISGVQKPPASLAINGHARDEDEIMQSSPYLPSSMPNEQNGEDSTLTTSIILAREEDMEAAKCTFETIVSIHVYSIQATVLQDLNALTDVCREVATTYAQDDPLECGQKWGMIQNRNVKPSQRRTGARPPPPAAPAPKAQAVSTVPSKRPLQMDASGTNSETKSQDSNPATASQLSNKSTDKAAPAKREKNSLFSSFAKTKPPKPKPSTPVESVTPNGPEDVVLDDASDDEQEELFPDNSNQASMANRETKKEREEKLRKMMEDDDADGTGPCANEEMPDADEEEPVRETTPVEQPPPSKPVELKEEVTVQGGRRRGKRQVMKKRTVKDEEGYLVTREEPSWESFSEDEPASKKKPAVNVAKSKGGKTGQGSIMSFFGKK